MKLKNIFVLLVSSTCLCMQSCENFTDLEPTDMVDHTTAFKDVASLNQVVIGSYSLMSLRNSMGVSEYIADDLMQGSDAGGAGTDLHNWTYTEGTDGGASSVWFKEYSIINNVNRLIHYGKSVVATNEADQVVLDNAFGQAYFLRAYAHFELLRFYADFKEEEALGIPYVSYPHVLGLPARDKVSYCYDYLLKDLEKAYNLIPASQNDIAFATKTAVQALRARICLYRKQYVHAYIYAKSALKDVALTSGEDYKAIWTDKTKDGVIMELPRFKGQSYIGTLFVGGDNSSVFKPSSSFMSIFDANDIRRDCFFGKGPDRGGDIVDRVTKYIGTSDNIGLNDEKLFRASEMKLIEIEALAQQDRLVDANEALNALRALRIAGWNNQTYASKENLLQEILLERRRELAFENHRFFDLRRAGLSIVRGTGNSLSADHYRMLMPIPKSEIESNKNIKGHQNLGY